MIGTRDVPAGLICRANALEFAIDRIPTFRQLPLVDTPADAELVAKPGNDYVHIHPGLDFERVKHADAGLNPQWQQQVYSTIGIHVEALNA